ncbi:MAG: hypothetical protein JXK94_11535, partial [Deltaproteobacteria bacterium]|nr:hypothetical protein [Deltaproteobacteria bacterium]
MNFLLNETQRRQAQMQSCGYLKMGMKSFVFLLMLLLCFASGGWADTEVSGVISTDTVWTLAGSPYLVNDDISVHGTDGDDGVTTLTIEPGVEVRVNRAHYIGIGASSGDPGALVAQGTEAAPILFTSNDSSPARGDWYGIRFYNTARDSLCLMEHAT